MWLLILLLLLLLMGRLLMLERLMLERLMRLLMRWLHRQRWSELCWQEMMGDVARGKESEGGD